MNHSLPSAIMAQSRLDGPIKIKMLREYKGIE